jgi:hypothetical protein
MGFGGKCFTRPGGSMGVCGIMCDSGVCSMGECILKPGGSGYATFQRMN